MRPDEYLDLFSQEALELVQDIEQGLIQLEKDPRDKNLLNRIFRAAHTIKGNAGLVGLDHLAQLTHAMESLFDLVRNDRVPADDELLGTLLAGLDLLRGLVQDVRQPVTPEREEALRRLSAQVEAQARRAAAPSQGASRPPADARRDATFASAAPGPAEAGRDSLFSVLPQPPRVTFEPPVSLPGLASEPPETAGEPAAAAPGGDGVGRADSVRVGVKVLDRLMVLAGEMVLTRNQLLQAARLSDRRLVERSTQRVDQLTTELQDAVMATRMQSIRVVFDRFARTVRDLSRELGKKIKLVIEDEGVELDRTVIEAISDPLGHLVRNAIDHGLETPDQRRAAGKQAEGRLVLRASQRAGQVVVEVSDDGRGIDPEEVKRRAVALGLLRQDEAQALGAQAARELIFRPAFSTATQVTKVSGRGVGLDVVQGNLSVIGGTVQVMSTQGHGSTFRIKLPLTLAILPSLLVEVEGERFAIPQVNLVELVRVRAQDAGQRIERVAGVDVIRIRGELVPIVRLRDLLGIEEPTFAAPAEGQRLPDRRQNLAGPQAEGAAPGVERRRSYGSAVNVAVVSAGDHAFGLVVDALLDSMEIVVKPLGRHLAGCAGYAGATVLGDGRAAMILDVSGLARLAGIAQKALTAAAARRARAAAERPPVEMLPMLLVEGGERERFGVPLDVVERVRKVTGSELEVVGGRRVLRGEHRVTPLFTVDQASLARPLPEGAASHVVLFRVGGRSAGLLVADVLDIVEVEATFDTVTCRQPGFRGSLVLGDRVVVVLNPAEIVRAASPDWDDRSKVKAKDARVLVVDDSPFFLQHITDTLAEAGYVVQGATDGAEALDVLLRAEHRFDLVVTDLQMPNLDGFELVERMRATAALQRVPVIAVTSLVSTEARQRARDVGIDEYAVKLDREVLLERCRHLVEVGRPEVQHEH